MNAKKKKKEERIKKMEENRRKKKLEKQNKTKQCLFFSFTDHRIIMRKMADLSVNRINTPVYSTELF